jgi:hypothetical protein
MIDNLLLFLCLLIPLHFLSFSFPSFSFSYFLLTLLLLLFPLISSETFVFPTAAWTEPVPDRSPQANILLETFPSFMHFFMADGEGLKVAEMKEISSTLSSKRLELFGLPTLDLLTLAKKNEGKWKNDLLQAFLSFLLLFVLFES